MQDPQEPEKLARAVMERCSDCDVCRDLMDANCLLFPNLFRLFDLGEYILKKRRKGKHVFHERNCPGKMVYFPPCHQREQDMGMPYLEILRDLYGDAIAPVSGGLHCCGMAGIMWFKEEFHEKSRLLGKDLMEILKAVDPEVIVTDCLSCSLQFRQFTPYRVRHPVELLDDSVS